METITSTSNRRVKEIAALKEKKNRYSSRLFVAEGINIIKDLGDIKPVEIFSADEELARKYGATHVSAEVMKKLSDTVTPQGLLAVFSMPDTDVIPPEGNSLVLDGVQDPGNAGTMIRTAVATGFRDIYLNDCVDPFCGKAVRSSMGTIFRTRIHIGSREDTLSALFAGGCNVFYLDMAGSDIFLEPFDGRTALVVGGEAHGVGSFYRNAAKGVSLPMEQGVESLNAAVSAGIGMYRVFYKNKFGG